MVRIPEDDMTPYELDILLHYYCMGDDHPELGHASRMWNETREMLMDNHLLRLATDAEKRSGATATYRTTARANVWLEHILALPLPEYRMP